MDQRLLTFLTLCKTMNYRVTAEQLHMTQPAVTKQIQSLEKELDIKLFKYEKTGLKDHRTLIFWRTLQYPLDLIMKTCCII